MTSANVTEYRIESLHTGKVVGNLSQHAYCKTHWGGLLKYLPPKDFTITAHGLDEEEEEWEHDPVNLATFIEHLRQNGEKKWGTMEDIMKGMKKV